MLIFYFKIIKYSKPIVCIFCFIKLLLPAMAYQVEDCQNYLTGFQKFTDKNYNNLRLLLEG